MIRAYDEIYLEDAMTNLGVMMDYGRLVCSGGFDAFASRMTVCEPIRQFEAGNPRYLVGLSGIELAEEVIFSTGGDCGTITYRLGERNEYFWTGWAGAYLQWSLGTSFESLRRRGLSMKEILSMYPLYHEVDLSKFCLEAEGIMSRTCPTPPNSLKRQRKLLGLTQTELSERSGVSLRMIQAYEQGAQDISKAESGSLLRLAKVLCCSPETLSLS